MAIIGGGSSSGSDERQPFIISLVKLNAYPNPETKYFFNDVDIYNSSWNASSKCELKVADGLTLRIEKNGSVFQNGDELKSIEFFTYLNDDDMSYQRNRQTLLKIEFKTFKSNPVSLLRPYTHKLSDNLPLNISVENVTSKLFYSLPIVYVEATINIGSAIKFSENTILDAKRIRCECTYFPYTENGGTNFKKYDVIYSTFNIYEPTLKSLSVSGYRDTFYINEEFKLGDSFKCLANYNYKLDSNKTAYNVETTSYTHTIPELDAYGVRDVTVSYAGLSTTYKVHVVGIREYTRPIPSLDDSANRISYFRQGYAQSLISVAKATIEYDDVTEDYDSTIDQVDVHIRDFDSSAVTSSPKEMTLYIDKDDVRTKEELSWKSKYQIFPLYRLVVNSNNVKKNFNAGESFNFDGLSVTAYYGSTAVGDVDSVTITNLNDSRLEIIAPSLDTVGVNKKVVVKFNDGYNSLSSTYLINVNGIYSLTNSFENCDQYDSDILKLRIKKGETLDLSSIVYKTSYYENGILKSKIIDFDNVIFEAYSTSITGDFNLIWKYQEGSISLTSYIAYSVYSYASLSLINFPSGTIFYENNIPTLSELISKGNFNRLVVNATTTDNRSETLSEDEYTLTSSDEFVEGRNAIKITSILEPSVFVENYIILDKKEFKQNGYIRAEGKLNKTRYLSGETINLEGISVFFEMNDGSEQSSSEYVAKLVIGDEKRTSLSFKNSDEDGTYYDIEISANHTNQTAIIEDAVYLDGISDITNIVTSKDIYDIGEYFDVTIVTYTINYKSGLVLNNQLGNVSTSRTGAFSKEEANNTSTSACASVSVPLSIQGFSKSIIAYVRKVVKIEVTLSNNQYNYEVNDRLPIEEFIYTKFYNTKTEDSFSVVELDSLDNIAVTFSNNSTIDKLNGNPNSIDIVVTFSYTENGISVSTSLDIIVKTIRAVELFDNNNIKIEKLYFNKGDNFIIPQNAYLKVSYNDNSTEMIYNPINNERVNVTLSEGSIIDKNIESFMISYQLNGTYFGSTINVYVRYLDSLNISNDESISGTYYVGDELDLSILTVKALYKSTDESENLQELDDALYYDILEVDLDDGLVFYIAKSSSEKTFGNTYSYTFESDDLSDANTSIVARYNNISKIIKSNVSVLEVLLSTIQVTNEPTLSYVEGQTFVYSSLVVKAVYNNGYEENVLNSELSFALLNSDGSETDVNANYGFKLVDNGKTVRIRYLDKHVDLATPLTIIAKTLTNLEITSNPKVNWTFGDVISLSNLQGLEVLATYNDGSSVLYNSTVHYEDLTFNIDNDGAFDIGDELLPSNCEVSDSFNITVSLKADSSKTDSFAINIVAPKIKSIVSNTSSGEVKIDYINGDIFSSAGLKVILTMQNGWESTLLQSTNGDKFQFVYEGFSLNQEGEIELDKDQDGKYLYGTHDVKVTFINPYDSTDEITFTYQVNISANSAIQSARLLYLDNFKDTYLVGEKFTAEGLQIELIDVDGNITKSAVNAVCSTTPAINSVFRSAKRVDVTINYTKGNFSKDFVVQIVVQIPYSDNYTDTKDYKVARSYKIISELEETIVDFEQITHEEVTIKLGKIYDENGQIVSEVYPLFYANKIQIEQASGFNTYQGSLEEATNDCIGYIDFGLTDESGTVIKQAHVVLFDDVSNPIDGSGNIVVTFPHFVDGYSDRINKTKFGIVYNNRLFVSGNPNYKNCDWHSGAVNTSHQEEYDMDANYDYTYFSDLDYCYYGSDNTAIVGYDIYRDGDLIVVKEGSREQATLYRRNHTIVNATSYDGSSADTSGQLGEDAFPMFDINANGGDGGLSNKSIVNFVGETLILTKNGIKALTTKDDVYNSAKYTFDVSTYINPKLLKDDLSSALMFTYNEKLFVKTNNNLFIGLYELRNANNEYEWFVFDNLDINLFFECDDQLYFANDKGELYRFEKETHTFEDKLRSFVGLASILPISNSDDNLSIDYDYDTLVVNKKYAGEIEEGNEFHLLSTDSGGIVNQANLAYANLGIFYEPSMLAQANVSILGCRGTINVEKNYFEIKVFTSKNVVDEVETAKISNLYYDGRVVYFDEINEPNAPRNPKIVKNKAYILKRYDEDDDDLLSQYKRFTLIDVATNSPVKLTEIDKCRMSFIVNDLAVTTIDSVQTFDDGSKTFKLLGDHKMQIDFINYDGKIDKTYFGIVSSRKNIYSFYETTPFTFNSLSYTKTIWAWIIANDTGLDSYMDVGYFTSRKQGDYRYAIKSSRDARQLNFDKFSFDKVQFLNDKLPHIYTKRRVLGNVNFIRFVFKNNKNSNMVLTTLELLYTVAQYTKGVK